MRKWVATGGSYTFEIEEKGDGTFDITISSYMGTDYYWHSTLDGAKAWIKREHAGLEFSRFKQVTK
jgi:hypothetical protein